MKRYHEAGFLDKLKFPRNQMNFWEREDQDQLRVLLGLALAFLIGFPIGLLLGAFL